VSAVAVDAPELGEESSSEPPSPPHAVSASTPASVAAAAATRIRRCDVVREKIAEVTGGS
jgi:hypothetical protein